MVIDADLQDPPELLPAMVAARRGGADVVNMRRRVRLGESWWKRTTASAFYHLIERVSDVPIARDVGDFRLFSRRAVDALNQLPERGRFMKGAVRLGWLSAGNHRLRAFRSRGRRDQMAFPQAHRSRLRRHHRVLGRAAEGGHASRPRERRQRLRLCNLLFPQGADSWRCGAGLPDLDCEHAVPWRAAIAVHGNARRIRGAHLHRDQGRPIYLIDVYEPATVPSKSKSNAAR